MYHQLFWASADEDFSSTNPTCEESDPTEWQTNCPSARHGCALTGSTPTEQHGVDTFLLHEFSLSWTKGRGGGGKLDTPPSTASSDASSKVLPGWSGGLVPPLRSCNFRAGQYEVLFPGDIGVQAGVGRQ
ncbi:unnamed protein product [Mesocestoides corti]|uniref:Uncharacterized protein n=1 Tax=Mesocestoides corti TaxID=53468 RepID=A0A0R3UFP9_MESCO|nr:unnamed protein product [Mesocestoides corti]